MITVSIVVERILISTPALLPTRFDIFFVLGLLNSSTQYFGEIERNYKMSF